MLKTRSRARRGVVLAALCFVVAPVGSAFAQPAAQYEVVEDIGVMVPMRDGVLLATDVYRPGAEGRFPVVMSRTPYGRAELKPLAEVVAGMGFVFVLQDVRGRFDSEGEWEPFRFEDEDGHDAVAWAADQPWSVGKVAMIGGSYAAGTQWLAAKGGNEDLVGLVPFVSPGDIYDIFWIDGAFVQSAAQMWSALMEEKRFDLGSFEAFQERSWQEVFEHLPVADGLGLIDSEPDFFQRWLEHPTSDDYWAPMNWQSEPPSLPVLHITGWYDIFQNDTIENFELMRRVSDAPQRLVVGPWPHQGSGSTVGAVDFGPNAAVDIFGGEALPFLLQCFTPEGPSWEKPVSVFTMGENEWREYDDWPVPGTDFVEYSLASDDGANSADGDGRLEDVVSVDRREDDRFLYDPLDPVPTGGGGTCCWPTVVPWGPFDQREIETRADVLVYSTPPLEEDLRVTGPIEAVLYVSSSAPDTDFTAKLVDVGPDGFAMNLTDGIVRVSRRSGDADPEFIEPGQVVEVRIDLGNTSNLFRAGHQVRLEISSSNFPRFSRHTNTREQPELVETPRVAEQTVHHSGDYRSRLILPVLPAP